jgi:NADH dehydrogenase [ubiquinone] 1 alpha subcomplex assembly factor 5
MPPDLFDADLLKLRRKRAARLGGDSFLHERAFTDCLERIGLIARRFDRALLMGCVSPGWPELLQRFAAQVDVEEISATYDLCLSIGMLDTIDDLPIALTGLRSVLAPDAFFIGALAGGDTLPQLRKAMRAADSVQGGSVPHVHPRIEAAALAGLLAAAGFVDPVVDVDRVTASYASLGDLVRDLRAMSVTNVLQERSRLPLTKAARTAAIESFASAGRDGRTVETFEILHFAAWTPARR